jgi:hypothetical protein
MRATAVHGSGFLSFISAIIVAFALSGGNALAEDRVGLYVGGAIGQGHVDESAFYPTIANPNPGEFKESHAAFKVMVGVRPISLLGAELTYIDFGHPSGDIFQFPANASLRGGRVRHLVFAGPGRRRLRKGRHRAPAQHLKRIFPQR